MDTETLNLNTPICRACLKLGAKTNIFSIHKPTSLSYSNIFSACIPVQVNPEDRLPNQICQKCLRTILSFYGFKSKVVENDLRLRQALETEIRCKDTNSELGNNVKRQSVPQNLKPLVINTQCETNIALVKEGDVVKNKTSDQNSDIKREFLDTKSLEHENFETQDHSDSEKSENFEAEAKNLEGLKEQIRVRKKKVHQCDVCGKILNNKSNLNQHYRKHTGERPYACDVCGKRFRRSEHVTVHKRTHTGERPHTCTVCSKSFNQYAGLKAHMRIHSGECPFVCSVCGKSFNHSSSLQYHKRIHSNETPYTCKTCQKSFKNAGYLKVHMRFHDDNRPFSCKMCDKKFFTSSHLNVHIKCHNNVTSHKCIICGKGFVRSQHLKMHLITHTGEKAHVCKLCPKKFTQLSHLNRHMKIHKKT